MLAELTSDDPTPTPFPRHTIKVYEEPRLREQDFGNFQPDAAEMARMWQERANYGHCMNKPSHLPALSSQTNLISVFYRIPNGESAADAYDRISGMPSPIIRLG